MTPFSTPLTRSLLSPACRSDTASVEDLRNLFAFHGAISRVAVVDGIGYVEYVSASCIESALMFDRTKFAGQKVSVAVVDTPLPDELWVNAAMVAQAAAKASAKGTASSSGSEVSPEGSDFERVEPEEVPRAPRAPPAAVAPPSMKTGGSTSSISIARKTALQRLAREPLNSVTALLGVTVGLQLLFMLMLA